jgi:hypothetical protein
MDIKKKGEDDESLHYLEYAINQSNDKYKDLYSDKKTFKF